MSRPYAVNSTARRGTPLARCCRSGGLERLDLRPSAQELVPYRAGPRGATLAARVGHDSRRSDMATAVKPNGNRGTASEVEKGAIGGASDRISTELVWHELERASFA